MKLKELTRDEFLSLIREDVEKAGSQKAVAYRIGVTQQYLSEVLREKRPITRSILNAYNATRNITYTVGQQKKEKH